MKKKRKCKKKGLNKKVLKKTSKKRWLIGRGEDVIQDKINESLSEHQTDTDRAEEIKKEDAQSNIVD